MEMATLAGGCFWCTEAVFQRLKGVEAVVSGYAGGKTTDPTYEQVSRGHTGHVEASQITFNPQVISYAQLLEVFFRLHDPTTWDRQGADVGSQYRSVVFYHTDDQKRIAKAKIAELQPQFTAPIVTQIRRLDKFYPAENDHQNYYQNHNDRTYCQLVIDPKLTKLYNSFKDYTRTEP